MSEGAAETTVEMTAETTPTTIGDEIRARRLRNGWTQQKLATELGGGVRREYVARWEAGASVTFQFWPTPRPQRPPPP